MKPQTLPEWEAYIKRLAGRDLWSKATSANTQMFVDALLGEGFTLADVQTIMLYFVRQLVATAQKIPVGGAFNLLEIARKDPLCRKGQTVPDDTLGNMRQNPPAEEDDFDAALEGLANQEGGA